jgi:farnesyl-diphosphate farnesyltransferase
MEKPEALLARQPGNGLLRIVHLLPEPLRSEVTLAYLLLRNVDTLEDALNHPYPARCEALRAYATLLDGGDGEAARNQVAGWASTFSMTDAERVSLLKTAEMLTSLDALRPGVGDAIRGHVTRVARRMSLAEQHLDASGRLCFTSPEQLLAYCYTVSGIVGELLTDLFLLEEPRLQAVAEPLRAQVVGFGEAVQLVNILRDEAEDVREGRCFLPEGTSRREWMVKARQGFQAADSYSRLLQEGGAHPGVVEFVAGMVRQKSEQLDALIDAEGRPGADDSRHQAPDSSHQRGPATPT